MIKLLGHIAFPDPETPVDYSKSIKNLFDKNVNLKTENSNTRALKRVTSAKQEKKKLRKSMTEIKNFLQDIDDINEKNKNNENSVVHKEVVQEKNIIVDLEEESEVLQMVQLLVPRDYGPNSSKI